MSSQDSYNYPRRSTSSPWDKASLITVFILFSAGALISLHHWLEGGDEYQYPDDWDPVPDSNSLGGDDWSSLCQSNSRMDRDPITGAKVPPNAIQRVLHISPSVHVYRIPPITSNRGFNAATWTQNPADRIFTARLRVIETAIPPAPNAPPSAKESISVNILLEDPSTSQLFAAAPYAHPSAVEQALDSSRFFAVRVVGEGGMRATLGVGFEQRPEAFEFVVTLQDVRRTLGLEGQAAAGSSSHGTGRGGLGGPAKVPEKKLDLSLKEGEMITINIGGKAKKPASTSEGSGNADAFAILPPPPSAASVKAKGSAPSAAAILAPPPASTAPSTSKQDLEDLGFDDGEFGEFQ
jgi:adaptin ear-binding coat-associated protein 1/2